MELDRIIAVRSDKTVYQDGDLTAKVFGEGFSAVAVLAEALNHARIETTPLKIPPLREVTTLDGRWAIIRRYIPGKSMSRLMKENPDRAEAYLERLARLHMEVHRTECALLEDLADRLDGKLRQAGLGEAVHRELQTRLNGMPRQNTVCHGDFCPSNVIITPDDEAYIIDWAHAARGNPMADVARTYLLLCLQGNPAWAECYLERICGMGGGDRQTVLDWLPLVAAAQSVDAGEEKRKLLQRWITAAE